MGKKIYYFEKNIVLSNKKQNDDETKAILKEEDLSPFFKEEVFDLENILCYGQVINWNGKKSPGDVADQINKNCKEGRITLFILTREKIDNVVEYANDEEFIKEKLKEIQSKKSFLLLLKKYDNFEFNDMFEIYNILYELSDSKHGEIIEKLIAGYKKSERETSLHNTLREYLNITIAYEKKVIDSMITKNSETLIDSDMWDNQVFEKLSRNKTRIRQARYMLRRVYNSSHEYQLIRNNHLIHVEHIMPETLNVCWNIKPKVHEENTWKIGNLMLLEKSINTDIKNKCYRMKYQGYVRSKIACLFVIRENKCDCNFTKDCRACWNNSSIKNRQRELFEQHKRVWESSEGTEN